MSDESFLSRWARRKAHSRIHPGSSDEAPATPALAIEAAPPSIEPIADSLAAPVALAPTEQDSPRAIPTMADVPSLDIGSDFTAYMQLQVEPAVRNAALRRLFADPHFNVMDGLDVYIDDYGKPDPLPAGMLESLQQWQALSRVESAAIADAQVPEAPDQAFGDGACVDGERATRSGAEALDVPPIDAEPKGGGVPGVATDSVAAPSEALIGESPSSAVPAVVSGAPHNETSASQDGHPLDGG